MFISLMLLHFTPAVASPPTGPLEVQHAGAHAIILTWGQPESDGGSPLESYCVALRDTRRTMWIEVGHVSAERQRLVVKDLQVCSFLFFFLL